MTTTAFSMRIPEELKTSLKEMSALSHRSQSQIAIKAIAEYVNSACTKSHFFKNALLNLMNYFLNFDSASLKTHQLLRVLLVQCRFSTF